MSFFAMGQLYQGRAVYSKKKHVFVVKWLLQHFIMTATYLHTSIRPMRNDGRNSSIICNFPKWSVSRHWWFLPKDQLLESLDIILEYTFLLCLKAIHKLLLVYAWTSWRWTPRLGEKFQNAIFLKILKIPSRRLLI